MREKEALRERLLKSRRRYSQLLERGKAGHEGGAVTAEALQELATALEELRVAEEDLRIQNSVLVNANREVSSERNHFADLFESLPTAYVLTNLTGTIVSANPRAGALLKLPAGGIVGKPLTVFVPERLRREFRQALNQLAAARATEISIVTTIGRRPENEAVVQIDGAVTEFNGEQHIAWLMRRATADATDSYTRFNEEHTNRVTAERTLRRFRFLTEASRHLTGERELGELCSGVARTVTKFAADHCAIYLIEGAGLVRCATAYHDPEKGPFSEVLLRRFNITPDDVDGLLWRTILTGDIQAVPAFQQNDDQFGMRSIYTQLRDNGPRNAIVLPLRRRNHSFGALVALTNSAVPTFNAEDVGILNEVATRTALAIDNTQLLQKLERANEEKSEFMAVLSHELRTPLTAVIGYADLLLGGIPEALHPEALKHVERIRNSAWHQLTIVEQLLTHTRSAPKTEAVLRDIVNLEQVIEEVTDLVAAAATQKGLILSSDVPSALTLKTDPGRLRQILINLLWNAVKYTDTGKVEVRVRGSDDNVFIAVVDTGMGIAQGAIAHVFDAYWRGTDKASGVGLGLNVSQKLARMLGGEISVESAVGSGSTFTLRLPTE